MTKQTKFLWLYAMAVTVAFGVGLGFRERSQSPEQPPAATNVPILEVIGPSGELRTIDKVFEIQAHLARQGYDLRVDGKCGPVTISAIHEEMIIGEKMTHYIWPEIIEDEDFAYPPDTKQPDNAIADGLGSEEGGV